MTAFAIPERQSHNKGNRKSPKKDFSYKFAIKNTTAIFLTLMWLPAVLKIFALSGGVLKTPAGEFDSSEMINML